MRDEQRGFEPETIDEALWSLEQLGPAALPAVFDFVRYSGNGEAREDLLDVLGVSGPLVAGGVRLPRGQIPGAELHMVYDKLCMCCPWPRPGDARAVPMLCDAPSDPAWSTTPSGSCSMGWSELGGQASVDNQRQRQRSRITA